ncbi:MAG: HD domain-containing protein [Candidatus Bathyarchaeota archaeon]|nr:HD domain-containing protein [Candidatus Bathyarchaeota archaeon]
MEKLTKKEENMIKEFVKKKVKNMDLAHNFEHVRCVVNLAKKIGKIEGANLRIVIPAAYLHDVNPEGKNSKFSYTTMDSSMEAENFLKKVSFNLDEILKVKEAIISTSFTMHEMGISPKTLEAKVVRDADFLDAMGARGIARVFATAGYYGAHKIGKVKWNPEKPVKLKMNTKGLDPTPIYHFFSKLLWLKNLMQTKTGRKMAEKRHKFMVQFLKRYKAEYKGLT